jgi:hypothetical protein
MLVKNGQHPAVSFSKPETTYKPTCFFCSTE